jgi:hypothetical protein
MLAFAIVFVATSLIAGLVMYSLAVFTDRESVDRTMETATLNLTLSQPSAQMDLPSVPMVPGAQLTSQITVENGGTVELRYAVRSVTTENVLASALVLTIKTGVITCDVEHWALTGVVVYAGTYGSSTGTNVIGSNAQGAQNGDRRLAGESSEELCFHVALPSTAGNALQGLTSTATFTFESEQTANNP